MDDNLYYVNRDEISTFIQEPEILDKIMDIVDYLNYFRSNNMLFIQESNFNQEVDNILAWDEYTANDRRVELICLVVEESIECLGLMGFKLNDTIRVYLSDAYNLLKKVYDLVSNNDIKELTLENEEELLNDIFNSNESDGTDYYSIILGVTEYFVNNHNNYKECIIDCVEDLDVSEVINKLIEIDPKYINTEIVKDYLDKGNLENNEARYKKLLDDENNDNIDYETITYVVINKKNEYLEDGNNMLSGLLELSNVPTYEINGIINRAKDVYEAVYNE